MWGIKSDVGLTSWAPSIEFKLHLDSPSALVAFMISFFKKGFIFNYANMNKSVCEWKLKASDLQLEL